MSTDFFSIGNDKKLVKFNSKKTPEIKNKKLQTLFQRLCDTPTSEYSNKHGNIKDLKSLFQALDQIAGDDDVLSDEELGEFLDGWILTQDMSVAEFKEMLLNYDVEVQETPQDTTHEQNLELKSEIETKPLGAHTEYKTEGDIQIETYYDDNNQKTGEKRSNTATNETEVIEYFVNESGVDVTRSQKYDANSVLIETIEEEDSGVYKQRKTTYHQNGATKIETFDGNGNIEEATYTNKEQKSFNVQYMTDTEGNVYTQIVLQPGEDIETVFDCTPNDLARWNNISVDALNLHLDVPGTQLWIKGKLDPADPKIRGRMTASEIQTSRAESLNSDSYDSLYLHTGNFYGLDGIETIDEALDRILQYEAIRTTLLEDLDYITEIVEKGATPKKGIECNARKETFRIWEELKQSNPRAANVYYAAFLRWYDRAANDNMVRYHYKNEWNNVKNELKLCDVDIMKHNNILSYYNENSLQNPHDDSYKNTRREQFIAVLRPQVAEYLGKDPQSVTEKDMVDFINSDEKFSIYLTFDGIDWVTDIDIDISVSKTTDKIQSENEKEIASAANDVLEQARKYTLDLRQKREAGEPVKIRAEMEDKKQAEEALKPSNSALRIRQDSRQEQESVRNDRDDRKYAGENYRPIESVDRNTDLAISPENMTNSIALRVIPSDSIAVSLRDLKNERGISFSAEVALYVINNADTLRIANCNLEDCQNFARAVGISEIVIKECESIDDIKDLLITYTNEAIYEDPDFVKNWIKSADSLDEKKSIAIQAGLSSNEVNACKDEEGILKLLDGYGYATPEDSITSIKANWDSLSQENIAQISYMRENYCGLTKEIDKLFHSESNTYYYLSQLAYQNQRDLRAFDKIIENMHSISAEMEAQFEILESNDKTGAEKEAAITELNRLKEAYDKKYEEFKVAYNDLAGVEYDHKTFCHLNKQLDVYQQAVAVNKQISQFTDIAITCKSNPDFNANIDLVLKQLGDQLTKKQLVEAIIQLAQMDEATFNNLPDKQKCDMLANFCALQNAQLQAYYQDLTGGKDIKTLKEEIKETTDLLDGGKQENLHKKILKKAEDMAETSMVVSIAVQILVTVVLAVISCGVGAALMTALNSVSWLSKCPALMSAIQVLFSGTVSAGGSTLSQLILNDGSVDEGQVLEAFAFGCLGGAESKILSSLGMRDSGLIRETVESLWGACDSYAYNTWINPPESGYGSREFFQEFVSDFASSQLGGKVARGLENIPTRKNIIDSKGKHIGYENKKKTTLDGKDAQRIVTEDLNGNILGVRYVIPEDNKTTIKYFGPDGKTEVGKQETIFDKTNPKRTETRIFDENGNLQKIQIFNTDDANNTITVVTKDASGRKTSEAVYTKGTDGQIGEPQKYTSYQLREDGKIVKITRDMNKPTGEVEQEVQSALTITKDTQDLASYDGEFVKTEDGVYGYLETYDIEVDGEAPQKSFIIKPIGNSSIDIMGQQISCADMELPYNPKTGKVEPTLEFIKANFETIKNSVENKIKETQSAGNGLTKALEVIYEKAVASVDTEGGVTPSDADYQKAFNELQNINSLAESIIKNPEGANFEYFDTKQNFPGGKSAEFAITTASDSGNITTYFNDAGEIVAIGQPKSKVDATEPPVIVMSNEDGTQTQYFRMDSEYISQDIARRVLNNFTKQANTEVPSRENFANMYQASLDGDKITTTDRVSMQTYINTLSYNDVIALRNHLTPYEQSSKKAFAQINEMLNIRLFDLQREHTNFVNEAEAELSTKNSYTKDNVTITKNNDNSYEATLTDNYGNKITLKSDDLNNLVSKIENAQVAFAENRSRLPEKIVNKAKLDTTILEENGLDRTAELLVLCNDISPELAVMLSKLDVYSLKNEYDLQYIETTVNPLLEFIVNNPSKADKVLCYLENDYTYTEVQSILFDNVETELGNLNAIENAEASYILSELYGEDGTFNGKKLAETLNSIHSSNIDSGMSFDGDSNDYGDVAGLIDLDGSFDETKINDTQITPENTISEDTISENTFSEDTILDNTPIDTKPSNEVANPNATAKNFDTTTFFSDDALKNLGFNETEIEALKNRPDILAMMKLIPDEYIMETKDEITEALSGEPFCSDAFIAKVNEIYDKVNSFDIDAEAKASLLGDLQDELAYADGSTIDAVLQNLTPETDITRETAKIKFTPKEGEYDYRPLFDLRNKNGDYSFSKSDIDAIKEAGIDPNDNKTLDAYYRIQNEVNNNIKINTLTPEVTIKIINSDANIDNAIALLKNNNTLDTESVIELSKSENIDNTIQLLNTKRFSKETILELSKINDVSIYIELAGIKFINEYGSLSYLTDLQIIDLVNSGITKEMFEGYTKLKSEFNSNSTAFSSDEMIVLAKRNIDPASIENFLKAKYNKTAILSLVEKNINLDNINTATLEKTLELGYNKSDIEYFLEKGIDLNKINSYKQEFPKLKNDTIELLASVNADIEVAKYILDACDEDMLNKLSTQNADFEEFKIIIDYFKENGLYIKPYTNEQCNTLKEVLKSNEITDEERLCIVTSFFENSNSGLSSKDYFELCKLLNVQDNIDLSINILSPINKGTIDFAKQVLREKKWSLSYISDLFSNTRPKNIDIASRYSEFNSRDEIFGFCNTLSAVTERNKAFINYVLDTKQFLKPNQSHLINVYYMNDGDILCKYKEIIIDGFKSDFHDPIHIVKDFDFLKDKTSLEDLSFDENKALLVAILTHKNELSFFDIDNVKQQFPLLANLEANFDSVINHLCQNLNLSLEPATDTDITNFNNYLKDIYSGPKSTKSAITDLEGLIPDVFARFENGKVPRETIDALNRIKQNPEFKNLSDADKKVLTIATLLHQMYGNNVAHAAFDAFFIAKQYGLSDIEAKKVYRIIEASNAIEVFMSTSKDKILIQQHLVNRYFAKQDRENTFNYMAYKLSSGNDWVLAQMLYSTKEVDGFTRYFDQLFEAKIQEIQTTRFTLPQTTEAEYTKHSMPCTVTKDGIDYKVNIVNPNEIENFYAFIHTTEIGFATGGNNSLNHTILKSFDLCISENVLSTCYINSSRTAILNNSRSNGVSFIIGVPNESQHIGYKLDLNSMGKTLENTVAQYFGKEMATYAFRNNLTNADAREYISGEIKKILYPNNPNADKLYADRYQGILNQLNGRTMTLELLN